MQTLEIILNCAASLAAILFIVIGIIMSFHCAFSVLKIKDDIEVLESHLKRIGRLIEKKNKGYIPNDPTTDSLPGVLPSGGSGERINGNISDLDRLEPVDENIDPPKFDFVTHGGNKW